MIYDPYPFKRCSKCGEYSPATAQFFHRDHAQLDQLSGACKRCRCGQRRNYRKTNPDKERDYAKSHQIQTNKNARKRYHADIEKSRDRNKRQYRKNPDYYREWQRMHPESVKSANKRYRDTHEERVRERSRLAHRIEKATNPEKVRVRSQINSRRRKSLKRSLPSTFVVSHWRRALNYFNGGCAYCGNPPRLWDTPPVLHAEHFLAVTKSGGYTPDNIIPACQSCNLSKRNKDATEWLVEHFGPRRAKTILKRVQDYFEWVKAQS